MSLLSQIEQHRYAMMACQFWGDAFYHHAKLAAKYTKQWRESNTLRAVK